MMWERDHNPGQPIVPKQPIVPPQPIVPKTSPADLAIDLNTWPDDPSGTLPPPAKTADPAQKKAGIPIVKVPSVVVPKIASFGSSVL